MTGNYTDNLVRIEPLLSTHLFYDTVSRVKHYWTTLQHFKLHENLAIIGDSDKMMVAVPSYHNNRFTKLELYRSGDCARVSYTPEYGGANVDFFVDSNNNLKAISAYNNESHQPLIDLFYGSDFVRFFNIVIPRTEVSEVLFQYSTVSSTDLSFIEDFL